MNSYVQMQSLRIFADIHRDRASRRMLMLQEFLHFPFECGNSTAHSTSKLDIVPRLCARLDKTPLENSRFCLEMSGSN